MKNKTGASGQDGGVGGHASPHCTTLRQNTTNLKTKNTQKCQKNTQNCMEV